MECSSPVIYIYNICVSAVCVSAADALYYVYTTETRNALAFGENPQAVAYSAQPKPEMRLQVRTYIATS